MSFVVSREDDFIPGFAAPGAANPSSSTRRGGAKQIEAQRPGGLLGFSRARPYRSGAPDGLARKKPSAKGISRDKRLIISNDVKLIAQAECTLYVKCIEASDTKFSRFIEKIL